MSQYRKKKTKPFQEPVVDLVPSHSFFLDCHTHYQSIFSSLVKQDAEAELYTPENFSKYETDHGLNRWAQHLASINVNCDVESLDYGLLLQTKVANVYGAFGIHPHEAKDYSDEIEGRLEECATHPKTLAIGEMGLDYHYMHSPAAIQQTVFSRQLALAIRLNKPIVIHTRDAEEDTKKIMQKLIPMDWPIHIHCFTGSLEFSTWLIESFPNLCIGFTGCITFPTADDLRKVVRSIPLNRLLLETDGLHF